MRLPNVRISLTRLLYWLGVVFGLQFLIWATAINPKPKPCETARCNSPRNMKLPHSILAEITVMELNAETPYKLLLSCPSGLSPSQVSVVFDELYDRIPHPDTNLEKSISEIWDQRVEKDPSLFNGTKFRHGHHVWCDGGSDRESHVCLHLGLTDYRTFVGTNLNPLWEKFLAPSEDDAVRCQHTSSPLGNGAIVETSDKKILVLQRSHNVGEFPGHFVFPGGHPEPQEIGIVFHHQKGSTDTELLNKKVSQEMFDSIVREVVEEIGVPSDSLYESVFVGISRRVMNVRSAAFFFMKCSLSSKEIQKMYSTAEDSFESTQIYTVSLTELENMASKMPGCHEGGLALYKLMVESGRILDARA